jgi:adenosylmethionine-8-amino-7-oxononanoate aminotransferase
MSHPAPDHADLLAMDRKQLHGLFHPTSHAHPLMVSRAEGVYLYTSDGRQILDGMGGLWNVNAGFGRRELAQAAYDQMVDVAYTSGFSGMSNPPSARLADRLAGLAHPDLNFTYFTSGGSESSDTSFKTARYYWQQLGRLSKTTIISRRYGYHGVTLAATAATGLPKYQAMFGPLVPGFVHIANPNPYRFEGDRREGETVGQAAARALEEAIVREGADNVAAFIVEPVQGAGGLIVPPDDYFPLVQEICRRYEVLLIVDEVICGFGRNGTWFGSHQYDIRPDILQFAKGVTSGYIPLGGVQVSDTIRDVMHAAPADQNWMHAYTYSGHAAACAVALANLDLIAQEGLLENSARMGARLLSGLQGLVAEFEQIDNARGVGLMCGIDAVQSKESRAPDAGLAGRIASEALARGLRTRALGQTLAFAPPLVISAEQVDELIDKLGQAIAAAVSH